MQIVPFVARTAAEAFDRIQAQMGPDAVVVNVRQLPVSGLARLWRKPRIEVLASPPENRRQTPSTPATAPRVEPPAERSIDMTDQEQVALPLTDRFASRLRPSRWKVVDLLPAAGFTHLAIQTVLDDLESQWGKEPPGALAEEIVRLRETLRSHWVIQGPIDLARPQVLVGPPGSGKTTLLCKWLTRMVLSEGRRAKVFQLDGTAANHSETLQVHTEILGVPVHRTGEDLSTDTSGEARLVDIPGVDWRAPRSLGELRRVLDKISGAQVHLVLNGAYEIPVLLSQIRAFSSLPLAGIMVTHLDEEVRWSKLWNLILGTPLELRFLGVGTAIPGGFIPAKSDVLNDRWLGPAPTAIR